MAIGGALAPLRRSDFRRLWIAQTVSIVGDKINQVALSIMVFERTHSAAQMGIVFAVGYLPAALFGLLSGPLVDRWDRRRTMVAADAIRACLVISIPFVVPLGMWAVYALAFSSATVSLFFEPSRMALVPSVVEQDELMAANSLDMTTGSIAELLGIGFAGALVAVIGWGSAFFVDGATFVVSALFVVALRHRALRREVPPLAIRVVWSDLRAGLERIRTSGVLRGVMVTYSAVAIGVGAALTLSIIQALDMFVNSGLPNALRITTVDLATTAGLLIGSIVIGVGGSGRAGRKYVSGIIAFGVLLISLCFARDIRVAAVVLFAMGIANEFFGIPMLTITQAHAEDEMRGRVMAVRMTVTRLAAVVGLALAGVAAQVYGVVPSIAGAGVYLTLLGVFALFMPALREA